MDQFIATETLVIELLLIVSVVALVVRRLRIPYTVALVIVGLLLTSQQPLTINLTPDLILALFVPPLVFEAAFHLDYRRLRDNMLPILTLAVPGVLLTTLIVGAVVSIGGGITLATGLVFGALISATDPGPWWPSSARWGRHAASSSSSRARACLTTAPRSSSSI